MIEPNDLEPWPCKLLPFETLNGPDNMSRDEAMLDMVADDPSNAAFRVYGWSEPTLSLGYFQSVSDIRDNPRWQGVAVVRRPSGGGAILHDHELTFALVVPRGHPLARKSQSLYRSVHAALIDLIDELGLSTVRRGDTTDSRETVNKTRPFLCFLDRDEDDLVAGPYKVVGSAQRRRSGAVLQHGSVLFKRSSWTPELPGLSDLRAGEIDLSSWVARVRIELPCRLGLKSEESEWPEAILQRAAELSRSVYGDERWLNRR